MITDLTNKFETPDMSGIKARIDALIPKFADKAAVEASRVAHEDFNEAIKAGASHLDLLAFGEAVSLYVEYMTLGSLMRTHYAGNQGWLVIIPERATYVLIGEDEELICPAGFTEESRVVFKTKTMIVTDFLPKSLGKGLKAIKLKAVAA